MKKTIILIFSVAAGTILLIIALGIYKFNFTNDDIYYQEKKIDEVKVQNTTSTINTKENTEPIIIPQVNTSSEPSFRTPVNADPNSVYIQNSNSDIR